MIDRIINIWFDFDEMLDKKFKYGKKISKAIDIAITMLFLIVAGGWLIAYDRMTLDDDRFKKAVDDGYSNYSSPYGYQTDGEIRETLQNAVDDVEARIKLFDNLQDLAEGETNCIDSCTMMQKYGQKLYLIDGPGENIKITTPDDFYTMRAILEAKENAQIAEGRGLHD